MDSQRADVGGRLVCSVNTNKLDCRLLLSAVLQVFFFPSDQTLKKRKIKKLKNEAAGGCDWVPGPHPFLGPELFFLEFQTYIRSPDAVIHCWVCGFPG